MREWQALVSPEIGQRLAGGLERALAALAGQASVSFREARGPEALAAMAAPAAALGFSLTRGAAGPACLLLPGPAGLTLARAMLGESSAPSAQAPTDAEKDALRELAGQVAAAMAGAVEGLLGRPVGWEAPSASWLPGGGPELRAPDDGVVLGLGLTAGPLAAEALLLVPRSALPAPGVAAGAPGAEAAGPRGGNGIELLLDISLPVTVELGRTRMMIRDILQLAPGSVLELDKLAGEPVDIVINEKSIARGEVVVIDENFGVRLTNIVTPSERLMNLR